jgi:hypothetical protein
MCDPVSEFDSRGGGFYCCKCNSWFPEEIEGDDSDGSFAVPAIPGYCCVKHREETS